MRWPIAIAAGFFVVALVNATFIWLAVTHSDAVDPTYRSEHR